MGPRRAPGTQEPRHPRTEGCGHTLGALHVRGVWAQVQDPHGPEEALQAAAPARAREEAEPLEVAEGEEETGPFQGTIFARES